MKRRSLWVLLTLTFSSVLCLYIFFTYLHELRAQHERIVKKRSQELIDTLIDSSEFMKQSRAPAETLAETLRRAKEKRLIDFFVIRRNGKVLESENIALDSKEQIEVLNQTNQMLFFDNLVVLNVPIENYIVSVGFNRDWARFRNESFKMLMGDWMQDLIFLSIMVAGIFLFFFKDIFKMIRRFDQLKKGDIDTIKPMSLEAEKLKRAIAGYETQITELTRSRRVFENQLYSAVRREIAQGAKPPYTFQCTIVRTDLNNYSENKRKSDPIMFERLIDDYFMGLMKIIHRYQGCMTEFLGDELIFYFKDQDHLNSVQQALACVRDMNGYANMFSARSQAEMGFDLRMKTSLSHSDLEVREATKGFDFRSYGLIETVRVLKEIEEKDSNVILYPESVHNQTTDLIESRFEKAVELKGVGSLCLYRCHKFKPLEELTDQWVPEKAAYLSYYRSDSDVLSILEYLNQNFRVKEHETLLATFKAMNEFTAEPLENPAVVDMYRNLLLGSVEMFEVQPSAKYGHWLASVVALSSRLIATDAFLPIQKEFMNLLFHKDGRILANVVEALQQKSVSDESIFKRLWDDKNNRVAANALVLMGQRDVSADVLSRLTEMLSSKSPFLIASGLFALGEIAAFHRERNAVYFEAHLGLQHAIKRISDSFVHPDEMVRRQGLIAARKVGSEDLKRRVEEVLSSRLAIGTARFKNEVAEHFQSGPKKFLDFFTRRAG